MKFVLALLFSTTQAINHKYRPPTGSVPWHDAATRPTWDTPDYPVNYYVPNFGMDHNILASMNSLKIAETASHKESSKANFSKEAEPNLKTVDLGKDVEVKMAQAAINEAQKESG